MRASKRSKLTTVMMFLSGPHVFQIAPGIISAQRRALTIQRVNGLHRWRNYPFVVIQSPMARTLSELTPRWESVAAEQTLFGTSSGRGNSRKKRDPNLAHRHFNLGTDLEQPEPNRIALSLSQLGSLKSPSPQRLHHDVSER